MFTGIIEALGIIKSIEHSFDNLILSIESPISPELKIDQSIAHNGICLTVTAIDHHTHTVCAVKETIDKTTIGTWQIGDKVNLERCMLLGGRLDGHIVQGHVDATALCIQRENLNQNWNFTFDIDSKFAHLIIEKGSVTINGTSLTCYNLSKTTYQVTIIPYTYEHTSISNVEIGTLVNIEFDLIGKYMSRMTEIQSLNQ